MLLMILIMFPRRETRDCKLEGQCVALTGQFLCSNGLCHNLTRVMDCAFDQVGSGLQF